MGIGGDVGIKYDINNMLNFNIGADVTYDFSINKKRLGRPNKREKIRKPPDLKLITFRKLQQNLVDFAKNITYHSI